MNKVREIVSACEERDRKAKEDPKTKPKRRMTKREAWRRRAEGFFACLALATAVWLASRTLLSDPDPPLDTDEVARFLGRPCLRLTDAELESGYAFGEKLKTVQTKMCRAAGRAGASPAASASNHVGFPGCAVALLAENGTCTFLVNPVLVRVPGSETLETVETDLFCEREARFVREKRVMMHSFDRQIPDATDEVAVVLQHAYDLANGVNVCLDLERNRRT